MSLNYLNEKGRNSDINKSKEVQRGNHRETRGELTIQSGQ